MLDCTLETAQRIAEGLRQAIRDFRFVWQDRVMKVGVSIGLAEINGRADTLGAVMSAADVACYSAKDSGRNRVQTYRQGRAPERHREMQWVSRINRACEEDQLVLLCTDDRADPSRRRETATLRTAAADARRDGQLVPPAEFIPAAERFNLMPAVDRWVVRQACTRLAHRRSESRTRDRSHCRSTSRGRRCNDEQFLEFVIAEMTAADVSPGALCFEAHRGGGHDEPRRGDALHP